MNHDASRAEQPHRARLTGRWHGCLDTFNGVVLMTVVTLRDLSTMGLFGIAGNLLVFAALASLPRVPGGGPGRTRTPSPCPSLTNLTRCPCD